MSSDAPVDALRQEIVSGLRKLTSNQLRMVSSVVQSLQIPIEYTAAASSDLVDSQFAEVISNFLVLHHALHEEALNKKPFEYVLKQCLLAQGNDARLNPAPGESAYDVEGKGIRWSLKTEAAKGISPATVKIEKFMEARWVREATTPELCSAQVRTKIPSHMQGYDRILVLRAFQRIDGMVYQLEEIPKSRLMECFLTATPALFERKGKSPSFGADFYLNDSTLRVFRVLLDSSVEKIRLWYSYQHCIHHGTWRVPMKISGAMQLYTSMS
jgi:hypothetical protein